MSHTLDDAARLRALEAMAFYTLQQRAADYYRTALTSETPMTHTDTSRHPPRVPAPLAPPSRPEAGGEERCPHGASSRAMCVRCLRDDVSTLSARLAARERELAEAEASEEAMHAKLRAFMARARSVDWASNGQFAGLGGRGGADRVSDDLDRYFVGGPIA